MEANSLHSLHSTVEIIKKQVTRDHFSSFLFSFITDSIVNLTAKRLLLVGTIFSIIYAASSIIVNIIICYQPCIALNFETDTFFTLQKIANIFHFTPGVKTKSGDIIEFVPFYGQIIVAVLSTILYISFHLHRIGRYKGTFFHQYFLYFCLCLSTPLFTYQLNLIVSAICQLIFLQDPMAILFIIIGLYCIPALGIAVVRALIPLSLSGMPTVNLSTSKAIRFYFFATISICLDTICFYVNDNIYILVFAFVIIFFLEIYDYVSNLLTICFPERVTVFFVLIVDGNFAISSIIGIYLALGGSTNPTLYASVIGILLFLNCLLSFLFIRLRKKSILRKVNNFHSFQDAINSLDEYDKKRNYGHIFFTKDDMLINFFGFAPAKDTKNSISTKRFVQYVFKNDSYSGNTKIVALRYLFESGQTSVYDFIYEAAVNILVHYSTSLLLALQLMAIIELTADAFFTTETNGKSHDLFRQKQLDSVLFKCYEAHRCFWQSVLHASLKQILGNMFILESEIENVQNFFKQIEVDEKSKDWYGQQYIDFIVNIAGNYELLRSFEYEEIYESEDSQCSSFSSTDDLNASNQSCEPIYNTPNSHDDAKANNINIPHIMAAPVSRGSIRNSLNLQKFVNNAIINNGYSIQEVTRIIDRNFNNNSSNNFIMNANDYDEADTLNSQNNNLNDELVDNNSYIKQSVNLKDSTKQSSFHADNNRIVSFNSKVNTPRSNNVNTNLNNNEFSRSFDIRQTLHNRKGSYAALRTNTRLSDSLTQYENLNSTNKFFSNRYYNNTYNSNDSSGVNINVKINFNEINKRRSNSAALVKPKLEYDHQKLIDEVHHKIEVCSAANRFKMPGQNIQKKITISIFAISFIIIIVALCLLIGLTFDSLRSRKSTTSYANLQYYSFIYSSNILNACINKQLETLYVNETEALLLYENLSNMISSIENNANYLGLDSTYFVNALQIMGDLLAFYYKLDSVTTNSLKMPNPTNKSSFLYETSNQYLYSITIHLVEWTNAMLSYSSNEILVLNNSKDTHQKVVIYSIIIISIIFVLSIIALIIVSVQRAKSLRKISEQPLLINKKKISNIFIYFDTIIPALYSRTSGSPLDISKNSYYDDYAKTASTTNLNMNTAGIYTNYNNANPFNNKFQSDFHPNSNIQTAAEIVLNAKIIILYIVMFIIQLLLLIISYSIHLRIMDLNEKTYNDSIAFPYLTTSFYIICSIEIDNLSYDITELLIDSLTNALISLIPVGSYNNNFAKRKSSLLKDSKVSASNEPLEVLVPNTLSILDDRSMFQLIKISISSLFEIKLTYLSGISKAYTYALRCFLNSYVYLSNMTYDFIGDYEFVSGSLNFGFMVLLFAVFFISLSILLSIISIMNRLDHFVQIFCRICALLPEDSLFAQLDSFGNIDFWRERPAENQMSIIDAMPVGVAATDSHGNIIMMNTQLKLINKHIKNIHDLKTDRSKFFTIYQFNGISNPTDEYGRSCLPSLVSYFKYKVIDKNGKLIKTRHQRDTLNTSYISNKKVRYFIVKDETRRKQFEAKIDKLHKSMEIISNVLIPPTVLAMKCDRLMKLSQFVILELHLHDNFDDESFIKFKTEVMKQSEKLSNILSVSIKRRDTHAIFTRISSRTFDRQYIREGFLFAQTIGMLLGGMAKISLVNGSECLCEIKESEKKYFTVYSKSFIKSESYMKFIDFGEMATEWSILKFVANSEKEVTRFGTVQLFGNEFDIAVLPTYHAQ